MARYLIAQQADYDQAVAISDLSAGAKGLLGRIARMSSTFGEVLLAENKSGFSARMQHLTSLDELAVRKALQEAQDKGWCRWSQRKCREPGCPGRGCSHQEHILLLTYPPGVKMPGMASTGGTPTYELGAWLLGWVEDQGV